MADTHEERLLNELLLTMRAADEGHGAPGLEGRVLAAWDVHHQSRAGSSRYRYPVIASAAAAMILTYVGVSALRVDDAGPLPSVPGTPPRFASAVIAPLGVPPAGVGFAGRMGSVGHVGSVGYVGNAPDGRSRRNPRIPRDLRSSAALLEPLEFVPLMPLTRHEMSGPFQLVHVQLPRASLGAIAPPYEFPGQLVEADVLLGEDGMARAIRVSSNSSVSPWRSR